MKKLLMPDVCPGNTPSGHVRISARNAAAVAMLAKRTRQTQISVLDTLIDYALAAVELVPVDLYDLRMKEPEQ